MMFPDGHEERFESAFDALAGTPDEASDLKARAALMARLISEIQRHGWTNHQAALRCDLLEANIVDLMAGRISRLPLAVLGLAVQKMDANT